jgi:CheY-like chemotaxis protein
MVEKEKLILYVDDDEDDREFLAAAVAKASPHVQVKTTENGLQALEYLNASRTTHLPCLIVLDLNMPFLDGRETCRRIKADDVLKDVPLLIFSSSEKPEDKKAFNQQGIEFFTKPSHVEQIQKIAMHMVDICCK